MDMVWRRPALFADSCSFLSVWVCALFCSSVRFFSAGCRFLDEAVFSVGRYKVQVRDLGNHNSWVESSTFELIGAWCSSHSVTLLMFLSFS